MQFAESFAFHKSKSISWLEEKSLWFSLGVSNLFCMFNYVSMCFSQELKTEQNLTFHKFVRTMDSDFVRKKKLWKNGIVWCMKVYNYAFVFRVRCYCRGLTDYTRHLGKCNVSIETPAGHFRMWMEFSQGAVGSKIGFRALRGRP